MSVAAWWFDAVHLATIVTLAWGSVSARDPFTGIVRFIAFGLLAALAWARLGAPDLALAEAAIGAGLTGALLLSTLGRMGAAHARADAGEACEDVAPPRTTATLGPLGTSLVLVLALALGAVVLDAARSLARAPGPATDAIGPDDLARSGIESEVAAVLLDVRGYDTLLEMAVLFAAVLAVWCLGVIRFRPPRWETDPVLVSLTRWLLPLLVLVAAHLSAAGLHAPGGGFQGGAVLAAGGVLWTLADRRALRLGERRAARVGIVLGLAGLALAAAAPTLAGRAPLHYAPGTAPVWGAALELAIAVSVGLTLTALFMGGLAERPEAGDAGGRA